MKVKLYKNKSKKTVELGNPYVDQQAVIFEGGTFMVDMHGIGSAQMGIYCDEIREYIGDNEVSSADIYEAISLLDMHATFSSNAFSECICLMLGITATRYVRSEFEYVQVEVHESHVLLYTLFFHNDGEGSLLYKVLNFIHEKFCKMKDAFFKRYSITKDKESNE